ncbi:uncharacterized protein LOC134191776 [Corticium candelabrum]|uniref:uncharacterized protein LOC134191776 n=2 Tax=Corticium candelabrum TaxID=121492 RepID=UPI002E25DF1C|nr:uncharacterized protein LOC134191776 [Corticium candelabrum]
MHMVSTRRASSRRRCRIHPSFLRRQLQRRETWTTLALLLVLVNSASPERQIWSYPRSSDWWDFVVQRTFSARDWKENFRMCRETFLYLCEKLRHEIEPEVTHLRASICIEKRVAVTVWYLATNVEYRTISHLFGIGRSTVCSIVHSTCRAIVHCLMSGYITFPTGEMLTDVVKGFSQSFNFPQCAGAIDGCHIPVSPPALNHTDYYNRKGWYSVILQAVVDHKYLFRDINVGWPGSVHDARVLANSSIFQNAESGLILNEQQKEIEGCTIPVFLVGDSAYPLKNWLLKPFPHNDHLTDEKKNFNYRISKARIVVENAFGRLKARWRRLMKKNDMQIRHVQHVIAACCVLHNVCEIHGDSFDDDWMEETDLQLQHAETHTVRDTVNDRTAAIRETLVSHLANS